MTTFHVCLLLSDAKKLQMTKEMCKSKSVPVIERASRTQKFLPMQTFTKLLFLIGTTLIFVKTFLTWLKNKQVPEAQLDQKSWP